MTASDYRLKARNALAGKWGMAVLVGLVAALLGGTLVTGSASVNLDSDDLEALKLLPESVLRLLMIWMSAASILGIIHFIMGGPVKLGYCTFLLKLERRQEGELKDLFSHMGNFLNAFLLNLLTGIFIALWTLLFVIPGICATYSYAMAPFIMAENPDISANDAITASKEMMRGNRLELFFLDLSFIGWNLLALVTLGISTLFVTPYQSQAHAAFYEDLRLQAKVINN